MGFPRASRVKITRADGTVVYQQARGGRRGSVSVTLQRAVFARDGLCCRYCGFRHHDVSKFEVDHVVPVMAGGADELSNLVVACGQCNRAKKGRTWRPMSVKAAQARRFPIPQWQISRIQSEGVGPPLRTKGYATPAQLRETDRARRF